MHGKQKINEKKIRLYYKMNYYKEERDIKKYIK